MKCIPMLVALPVLAGVAPAQSARPFLEQVADRQQARWSAVNNYTQVQYFQGSGAPLYHEKTTVDGEAVFRVVPQAEWERRRLGLSRSEVDSIAEGMAQGLELIGDAHVQEVGGPGGAHIKSLTSEMAFFLRQAKQFDEGETRRDAASESVAAQAFAQRATMGGREEVGGRPAVLVEASDLGDIATAANADGSAFRLKSVRMWFDADELVPLRLTMTGSMATGGGLVTIELQEQAYEAAGSLYEPTRRVMRITGLMEASATDPRQKKELAKSREAAAKAREDLKRMDEQLAQMPAAQRRMIEGRLGDARKKLAMLVDQDIVEVELRLETIGVNEGPPFDWKPSAPAQD